MQNQETFDCGVLLKGPLLFCLCVFFFSGTVAAQDETPRENDDSNPRLEDCRDGNDVTVNQLVSDLARCDVVFLGEQHDNDSGHQFQLDVITELVNQGRSVVISTEQFERDVQGAVDDYLSGRIDEDSFLKASRPWKNYPQHYRPIIEFAKDHKLPVLAANVPRRIASDASSGKELALADIPFVPRKSTTTKNAYWQNFSATMKGHLGADGDEKLNLFFASQCLKDDSMAEAITDFLATNSHDRKIVVHLCGHFHSDYGLGTVSRTLQRNPLLRFTVVTMETPSADNKPADIEKIRSRGHYVFWSTINAKTDEPASEKSDDQP